MKNIRPYQDAFDKAFHVLHEGDTTGFENVRSAASKVYSLSHVILHGAGEIFQLASARRRKSFVAYEHVKETGVDFSQRHATSHTMQRNKDLCRDLSRILVSRTLSTHWIPLAMPPCFLIHASNLE
jgi:hypothetical protein